MATKVFAMKRLEEIDGGQVDAELQGLMQVCVKDIYARRWIDSKRVVVLTMEFKPGQVTPDGDIDEVLVVFKNSCRLPMKASEPHRMLRSKTNQLLLFDPDAEDGSENESDS